MTKPMLAELESKFLDLVFTAAQQRAPYVWGGKGDRIWTPEGVRINTYVDHVGGNLIGDVFDCAGLITTCLFRAGGPDLRFTHGAKHLRALLPELSIPYESNGLVLRFYPGHVALKLCESAIGPVAVLEAAGGDSTTLAPTARGYVRCNRERRDDFECERSLSNYLAAWCAS